MPKHLFLEGPSGIGKSTLLLEELGPLRRQAGGLVSLRLVDRDGCTRAFALASPSRSPCPVIPCSGDVPNVFLERGAEGTVWHAEVFEHAGMELLADAERRNLLVLDEIGGCELLSDAFRSRLLELLGGTVPCIGVLKSVDNAENMARRIGLPSAFLRHYRAFRRRVRSNPSVLLLSLSPDTREGVARRVRAFLSPSHPLSSEAETRIAWRGASFS